MDPRSIPAFPITEANGSNDGQPGMTLRDHYAGLAMHQFLRDASLPGLEGEQMPPEVAAGLKLLGVASYRIADAMLAAR